jgi:uracil phosphoribosyltransferase
MHIVSGIKLGQLLLQRNEESNEKEPIFYYSKLPSDIHTNKVLLCDPMVASGGSMNVAINILLKNGVPLENITVLAVVACPEGLKSIYETHKNVKIICAVVDPVLNSSKYICPGLGDFGDRYFGTL